MAHHELKRELKYWDSVAISVGIIVGVGIFRVPSVVVKYLSSPFIIFFAWIIAGFIALAGALCYGTLASRYPHTGGTYVFIKEGYGRLAGFLFGWTEIAILRAGSIAAVAYVFSTYLKNFFPLDIWGEKTTAISVIAILTYLNIRGVKEGATLQNFLSTFKVINLILISGLIFWFVMKEGNAATIYAWTENTKPSGQFSLFAFLSALVPILWTYGGWHETAFMSGEFKDPKKTLPLSMLVSTFIVMALYLVINAAYLAILTPEEMLQNKAVASFSLQKVLGNTGFLLVTIAVLISAVGALNSTIMTGGRIPFAVAQDFPKLQWASHIHKKFQTPDRALVINSIWAAVLVLMGTFDQLVAFCLFAQWLFFALAGLSIFFKRKENQEQTSFGYPWIPALFVIIAFSICVSIVWCSPKESFGGVILIMIGFFLYQYVEKWKEKITANGVQRT